MIVAPRTRRILHCDMDSFYAAIHVRDDPGLDGKPVVVGGDPAGRGVVAAASYAARKHGIHSAMPAARAKRLCPQAIFIPPDFQRYHREAAAIFAIYREFTPHVQTLSLDEAFLDVTDHLAPYGSATSIAHEIRRRVRGERRLTVSIGAAPNKLVAKIASDIDKPDGLTVVRPSQVADFLAPLPVRRLHGIGPATERTLLAMGIRTVADLRAVTLDRLIARFGSWGRTLWHHARGIDERPVHAPHARKSLSTERTFPSDVHDLTTMDGILGELAEEVSRGLERRRLGACTVTVKVRYPDFTTLTRSQTMGTPTSSAPSIARCAQALVRRTDAAQRSVRLLGVGASNLVSGNNRQLVLFE